MFEKHHAKPGIGDYPVVFEHEREPGRFVVAEGHRPEEAHQLVVFPDEAAETIPRSGFDVEVPCRNVKILGHHEVRSAKMPGKAKGIM